MIEIVRIKKYNLYYSMYINTLMDFNDYQLSRFK